VEKQQVGLIVPAAGTGKRLGRQVPKPYLKLAGKTVLEHTLRAFAGVESLGEVIVATSQDYVELTQEILVKVFPRINTHVVLGGEERQDSIRNALKKISGKTGLIAVHDAVRPFVELNDINKCIKGATRCGGAILATPAKNTIKKVDSNLEIIETPDRSSLWEAQTPQIFWAALVREAYDYAQTHDVKGFDDSSLVEKIGGKVVLIRGADKNFKITYPNDLKIAEYLLNEEKE
jgi:2-C-methyl-D-erythritol 4-phosphate cytidylyltransferase